MLLQIYDKEMKNTNNIKLFKTGKHILLGFLGQILFEKPS